MKPEYLISKKVIIIAVLAFMVISLSSIDGEAAAIAPPAMNDYCIVPPFVGTSVPPLVMMVMGRDHKLYYEAYNDVFDYDEDPEGKLDITYNHSVDYYGYFDSYKCYEYVKGGPDYFEPKRFTIDKFCGSGLWSGNILNWLTMSRMDALRKVIYGGYRSNDSTTNTTKSTLLERAFIPQDAHSWGKEFTGKLCNKGAKFTNQCLTALDCEAGFTCEKRSQELIGMPGPTEQTSCTAQPVDRFCSASFLPCDTVADCPPFEQCVYSSMGQILVAKYRHTNTLSCGTITDAASMFSSFEPQNLFKYYYVTDFNDRTLRPDRDRDGNDYNTLATTDFEIMPGEDGDWYFLVDGDDAAEVEIDGAIVASYYGCNGACFGMNPPNTGPYCGPSQESLAVPLGPGFHRIVVRHFEEGGTDGVRVWYKKPGDTSWTIFGDPLNLMSPDIVPGNECSLREQSFIQTGDPFDGSVIPTGTTARRHLFCNTSLGDGPNFPPLLRMQLDRSERIWEWASKEGKACDNVLGTPDEDYEVRVAVCVDDLAESNCVEYKGGHPLKPAGLMQKYGLNANEQVCSKSFTPCGPSLPACPGNESCVDRALMYFGLITGSYDNNLSGGLLRWNIDHVAHEVNNQQVGQIKEQGIIQTLNRMKLVQYNYNLSRYDNCGWITDRPVTQGECLMWGNPTAEMMYEGMRYFAGRPNPADPNPTNVYVAGTTGGEDQALGLPNLSDEGMTVETKWIAPYEKYPICSKPFMLVLSDVTPSYDSDQLPSVDGLFGTGIANDLPGFDAKSFTDNIGSEEGIHGGQYFIGQSGTNYDSICSDKSIGSLSRARGLCPEEPTKRGGYYAAGLAHYGKTEFGANNKDSTGEDLPDVTTYAVALSSPVPKIEIPIRGLEDPIQIVPIGVSPSDNCGGWSGIANTASCNDKCTVTADPVTGLAITNCSLDSFCGGNQIVDFYAETIRDDFGRFRINYEDVSEGADHDMDAIVEYEYCVGSACATPILNNQVKVSLLSTYASGCIDQALGFVISGTSEDGKYLVVKDADVGSGSPITNLPLSWSKTFTADGSSSAKLLENPLWYAAKWGGFTDSDADTDPGYKIPDKQAEWDEDGDGNPDTYFFVSNPLKLEQQLEKAFLDILRKASSGTAVSVLASGEERGANMLQAVFYPVKGFGELGSTEDITWTGRMQNLWFYLDPIAGLSNIREDTVRDRVLRLSDDFVTMLYFDDNEGKTRAARCKDNAPYGDCDVMQPTIDFEELYNLWEVGEMLFIRDPDDRRIFTNIGDNTALDELSTSIGTATLDVPTGMTVRQLLGASTPAEANRIIDYVRGVDFDGYCAVDVDIVCDENTDCPSGSCIPYRKRTATIKAKVCSSSDDIGCTIDADCPDGDTCVVKDITNTWKLGDIVSSTPRIVSKGANNDYANMYGDDTYAEFIESVEYKNRGLVLVGGNDGMLHAIRHGTLLKHRDFGDIAKVESLLGKELGKEEWGFIPKNALPYIKYLMDNQYCHLYYIDATPFVTDVSIGTDGCGLADYMNCTKTADTWRTVVIGSMRIGGACRSPDDANADPTLNVVAPLVDVGYSSYFALDITDNLADQANPPKLLWEFSHPDLGFSTSGPVIVRIAPKLGGGEPDNNKNGRWFVVITSGPTGPISTMTHEFMGTSDQNMKIFTLDIAGDGNGGSKLLDVKDSGKAKAFGNTSFHSQVDTEWFEDGGIDYQDDVVYLGYTQAESIGSDEFWTNGGVMRLVTKEDLDPVNWVMSDLITGVGPVTATTVKARDRTGGDVRLWVYFGTGRYHYRSDDLNGKRAVFGVIDPCFASPDQMDPACVTSLTKGQLHNATLSPLDTTAAFTTAGYNGWYIDLDCAWNESSCPSELAPKPYSAERVITHPLAFSAGSKSMIYFTSFSPTSDLCGYGGLTYLWAVDHATGGFPDPSLLQGTALIQVSTGEIKEIDLATAFTEKKQTGEPLRGRRTAGFKGVPPSGQGLSVIGMPGATQRILHMIEW